MRRIMREFRRLQFTLIFAAAFAMTFTLTACSSNTSSSKMTLNFPDWSELQRSALQKQSSVSSLATDPAQIEILSINITGPGMEPVTYLWNHKDPEPLKNSFTFDVKQGSGRIVQVLAVYGGEHTTQFLYGDDTINIGGATATANIALALKNTTAVAQGDLIGRYLDATGTGPTESFQYRFDPDPVANSKPSMVVAKGEIFAGWINAFYLNSRILKYTREDGSQLFDANEFGNLFGVTAATAQRSARIEIPAGFEDRNGNGSNVEERGRRVLNVGFFGPGATPTLRLCLNAAGSSIPRFYQLRNLDPVSLFAWSAQTEPSAPLRMVSVVQPLLGGFFPKGGSLAGDCTSAAGRTEYVNFLTFDEQRLFKDDGPLGFYGPFKRITSNDYLTTTFETAVAPARTKVNWQTLPGVDADLDGFSVFYRVMPTSNYNDDDLTENDGFRCNEFGVAGKFSPAFNEVKVAAGLQEASLFGVASQAEQNRTQIIVCPRTKSGTFMTSALSRGNNNGNGATAASRIAALAIDGGAATTAAAKKPIQTSTCSPIILQAKNEAGMSSYVGYGARLVISASEPSDLLYNDSLCSSTTPAATNVLTMEDFWGRRVVYLKSSRAPSATGTISILQNSPTPTLAPAIFHFQLSPKTVATEEVTIIQDNLFAFECTDALMVGRDALGAPAEISPYINFQLDTQPFMHFWDTSTSMNCGGAPEIYSSFTSRVAREKKFLYQGPSSSITVQPVPAGTSIPVAAVIVPVTQPGPAAKVGFGLPTNMSTASCYKVDAYLRDSNSKSTPNLTGNTIGMSAYATNGVFYTESTCTSAIGNSASVTIAPNNWISTTEIFYFRPTLAGVPAQLVMTALSSFTPDAPLNITVTQAQVARFAITLGGEYLDPIGAVTPGYKADAFTSGRIGEATLWALDSLGHKITSYNLPVATANLQVTGPIGISSGVVGNFSSGVAYLNVALSGNGTGNFQTGGGAAGVASQTSSPVEVYAPTDVQLRSLASFSKYSCQPILAQVVGSNDPNTSPQLESAMSANLNVTNDVVGNPTVYTDSACTVQAQPNIAILSSQTVFYVKGTLPGSGNLYAGSVGFPVTLDASTPGSATSLKIIGRDSLRKKFCAGFAVVTTDANNNAANVGTPVAVSLATSALSPAGTNGLFFSDDKCTVVASNVLIPAGSSTAQFFMRPTAYDLGTGKIEIGATGLGSYLFNFSVR